MSTVLTDLVARGGEMMPVIQDSAEARRTAAVCLRVRGKDYPLKFVWQCKTCSSPYRLDIEHLLLIGRSAPSIVASLPEYHGLIARNISDHRRNNHSPADIMVTTALMEAEYEGDIEAATGSIISHMGLLKNVVRLTGEGLQEGTIKVNLKEGVAAAQILVMLDMAVSENKDDIAGLSRYIRLILEHCQNIMAPPEFAILMEAFKGDPEMLKIRAEYDARRRELVSG